MATTEEVEYIPVSPAEFAALVRQCQSVRASFGTRGLALKWRPADGVREDIRALAAMRGVEIEELDQ